MVSMATTGPSLTGDIDLKCTTHYASWSKKNLKTIDKATFLNKEKKGGRNGGAGERGRERFLGSQGSAILIR